MSNLSASILAATPAPAAAPEAAVAPVITPPPAAPGAPPVAPPPEAPPAAPPPPPDRTADKFAMLTRKEQAAVRTLAEAKQIKAAADAATVEANALKARYGGLKGSPEKMLAFLEEDGITYEMLTQLKLNGGVPTAEMTAAKLQEQIDKLNADRAKDLTDAQQAELNRAQGAERAAEAEFAGQIQTFFESKPTDYPFLKHELGDFGQVAQEVYRLIDGHYRKTSVLDEQGNLVKAGQILEIEAAAKMAEDFLRNKATSYRDLLTPPQATPAAPPPPPVKQPSGAYRPVSQANTLTPATAPVTPPVSTKPKAYRSSQDEIAAIVAKAKAGGFSRK